MNTPETPAEEDARHSAAYSELESYLRDLERAVRITEILLRHDIEEMGHRQEMLSLLAVEDLRTRSKQMLDLYYRPFKDQNWEGT
jgi:hypothetical protein